MEVLANWAATLAEPATKQPPRNYNNAQLLYHFNQEIAGRAFDKTFVLYIQTTPDIAT